MSTTDKIGILDTLYQTLLVLFLFLTWPFIFSKMREGIKERLGVFTTGDLKSGKGNTVWVHAASVGEVVAVANLIRLLRSKIPEYDFVISTLTSTGRAMAQKLMPEAKKFVYFPFDLSWIMKKAIEMVNPRACIIAETELWPNFIWQTKKKKIPVILVNGRISGSSFNRYKMVRFFIRRVLEEIDLCLMQTEIDAERIVSLGAKMERVFVTGNLKFASQDQVRIQNRNSRPVKRALVCGSTHRGEEEIVLDAYKEIRKVYHDLVLVLAPRHPERTKEVERLLIKGKFIFGRSSLISQPVRLEDSPEVILVDTIGQLRDFYRLAEIVFVGGSLVPVGGHNVLEPASLGKPVLFGPYMDNYRDLAKEFVSQGAGKIVCGKDEMVSAIARLLSDSFLVQEMGEKALSLVRAHAQDAERMAEMVAQFLRGLETPISAEKNDRSFSS